MRRFALLAVALAVLVTSSALATDVYIFGTVSGRVPGKNLGRVAVRWDFKCLGGKLGDATYEYTLVAVRYEPKPITKVTFQSGTAQKGSLTTTLPPGVWQLQGDPFLCETDRGAGSREPEIGQTVRVPDFCTWVVTKSRGPVELEQGAAVKRAKPGAVLSPGHAVVTPAGGAVSLTTAGKDGLADVGATARVAVDRRQCASSSGGWKLALAQGVVAVTAKPGADGSRPHTVATPNATSTGGAASWTVSSTKKGGSPTTVVRVRSGAVVVASAKGGKRVNVKAGFRSTVVGTAAPTAPTRG
jgi:hypothetical protein